MNSQRLVKYPVFFLLMCVCAHAISQFGFWSVLRGGSMGLIRAVGLVLVWRFLQRKKQWKALTYVGYFLILLNLFALIGSGLDLLLGWSGYQLGMILGVVAGAAICDWASAPGSRSLGPIDRYMKENGGSSY